MKGRHFCRPNLLICEKTEVPSVGGDAEGIGPYSESPPAAEWHTVRISVTVSFSRISKFQKIQKSLLTNNRPGVTIMT